MEKNYLQYKLNNHTITIAYGTIATAYKTEMKIPRWAIKILDKKQRRKK